MTSRGGREGIDPASNGEDEKLPLLNYASYSYTGFLLDVKSIEVSKRKLDEY